MTRNKITVTLDVDDQLSPVLDRIDNRIRSLDARLRGLGGGTSPGSLGGGASGGLSWFTGSGASRITGGISAITSSLGGLGIATGGLTSFVGSMSTLAGGGLLAGVGAGIGLLALNFQAFNSQIQQGWARSMQVIQTATGPAQQIIAKFQEQIQSASNFETSAVQSAQTVSLLSGASYEDSIKTLTNIRKRLAQESSTLPGEEKGYIGAFDYFSDTIARASKVNGKFDAKKFEDLSVSLGKGFGVLGAGRDPKELSVFVNRLLAGQFESTFSVTSVGRDNQGFKSILEQIVKKRGIDFSKASDLQKAEALQEAFDKYLTPSQIARLSGGFDGIIEGFRAKLFGDYNGLFGALRDLDPYTEGDQTVLEAAKKAMTNIVGEGGLVDTVLQLFGNVTGIRDLGVGVQGIINFATNKIADIRDYFANLSIEYATTGKLPSLSNMVGDFVKNITDFLNDPSNQGIFKEILATFRQAINDNAPALIAAITPWLQEIYRTEALLRREITESMMRESLTNFGNTIKNWAQSLPFIGRVFDENQERVEAEKKGNFWGNLNTPILRWQRAENKQEGFVNNRASGFMGGLLDAALRESKAMPSGSQVEVHNSSEAVLTRSQQEGIASAISRPIPASNFNPTIIINNQGNLGNESDIEMLTQRIMSEMGYLYMKHTAGRIA